MAKDRKERNDIKDSKEKSALDKFLYLMIDVRIIMLIIIILIILKGKCT
jgi:hypothetical protein